MSGPGKPTNEARIKKLEEQVKASNGAAGLGVHEICVYLATFATLIRTGRVNDLRDLPGESGKMEDIVSAALEKRDDKPLVEQINSWRERFKESERLAQERFEAMVIKDQQISEMKQRLETAGLLPQVG